MQLTHWNYTKEEWKTFLHWKTKKKGLIFFLLRRLIPVQKRDVPEIRISTHTVSVNNAHKSFQNNHCQFREIFFTEAGTINIMEISYEQANKIRGIKIPIPKGKLREAFEIQDRLDNCSFV